MSDASLDPQGILVVGTATMGQRHRAPSPALAGYVTHLHDVDPARIDKAISSSRPSLTAWCKARWLNEARSEMIGSPGSPAPEARAGRRRRRPLRIEAGARVDGSQGRGSSARSSSSFPKARHPGVGTRRASRSPRSAAGQALRRKQPHDRPAPLQVPPPPLMELLEVVRGLEDPRRPSSTPASGGRPAPLQDPAIVVNDTPGFASSQGARRRPGRRGHAHTRGQACLRPSTHRPSRAKKFGYRHPMGPLKLRTSSASTCEGHPRAPPRRDRRAVPAAGDPEADGPRGAPPRQEDRRGLLPAGSAGPEPIPRLGCRSLAEKAKANRERQGKQSA